MPHVAKLYVSFLLVKVSLCYNATLTAGQLCLRCAELTNVERLRSVVKIRNSGSGKRVRGWRDFCF